MVVTLLLPKGRRVNLLLPFTDLHQCHTWLKAFSMFQCQSLKVADETRNRQMVGHPQRTASMRRKARPQNHRQVHNPWIIDNAFA